MYWLYMLYDTEQSDTTGKCIRASLSEVSVKISKFFFECIFRRTYKVTSKAMSRYLYSVWNKMEDNWMNDSYNGFTYTSAIPAISETNYRSF